MAWGPIVEYDSFWHAYIHFNWPYYIVCIQVSHVGHFIMVDKLLSSRKSVASTSNNEESGQNTVKGMAIMILERF